MGARWWHKVVAVAMVVAMPLLVHAEPAIKQLEVVNVSGGEQLNIHATAPLSPKKIFFLANPDRLVVDLPPTRGGNLKLPRSYKGSLIKGVRFGRFDAQTSRLVIDLSRSVGVAPTRPGNPLMLSFATGAPASKEARVHHTASAGGSANAPRSEAVKGEASATPTSPTKPLIVIDAGHGGQDPGASGLHGTHEKIITLNYARALRDALIKTGRYRAQLTRDDDRYILLPERVNIARRAHADIFISIHADSNPRSDARGLSVYTLSDMASDAEAAALAERENKSDIISGLDLNTTDPDVANILIDLTQRETMNKSSTMAENIVTALRGKITTLGEAHRYAGFRVLKAPDIPSTLIELGFLTNAADERELLSTDYRDTVVAAIVKGIDRYEAGQ